MPKLHLSIGIKREMASYIQSISLLNNKNVSINNNNNSINKNNNNGVVNRINSYKNKQKLKK